MNNRLDLLLRKQKGQQKIESCKQLFLESGFPISNLNLIELEACDNILQILKSKYDKKNVYYETISESSYERSMLLMEIKDKYAHTNCYVYSYDCQECGMYLVNIDTAIQCILKLSQNDYQNTAYLIDENFKYGFTINFNDETYIRNPNIFDIQLWKSTPEL